MYRRRVSTRPSRWQGSAAAVALAATAAVCRAQDVSQPAILQDFENSWQTISNRAADAFAAGYGTVYLPPPGRAGTGSSSVGYDPYDRFDLGRAGKPTLYGTEAGLRRVIAATHAWGGNVDVDLIWNHSGFADLGTAGFAAAGGYPGFALTLQTSNASSPGYNTQGYNRADGDYHSAYATGDQNERISGLVDIAQETTNVFVRQPTVAGPDNIPGPTPGAVGWNGFPLANVPNAANARFYPDLSGTPQKFTDAAIGPGTLVRYSYNTSSPSVGTPVAETAQQYLARYAQWMVQSLGVDGFRVDAAKNMPPGVLNYLDLATYQASNRTLLNGQRESVGDFSEVYDGSASLLQQYVNKSAGTATAVGGNRDVYDFPLFFALQSNLTTNGAFGASGGNNWNNVVTASIDLNDDGLMNGSQGVHFVDTHDNGPPALGTVGYAYTLMLPGKALVYFNGHEFGTEAQRSFPQDGREDALGGVYGSAITTLVDLRNRYGRGNYRQDYLEQNNFAFERQGAALVLLSNCTDTGYDSRTIPVTFAVGTELLEQTGNAHGSFADPAGNIPQVLVVNADSSSPTGASVNARFLRNATAAGSTGDGYLVYGLPTPKGTLSVTGTAGTFGGSAAKATDANVAYENGTQLVGTVDVVKAGTFTVSLATTPVTLPNGYRDTAADGDNAIFKIDGGVDVTGGGLGTDPTNAVTYGFEPFATASSPGFGSANGSGSFVQTINAYQLGQGYHYLTVEAFRHRTDGGPAVYTDWRQTVYVDLAPPASQVTGFAVAGSAATVTVQNVDELANNVHTLLDLPAGLTDAQVAATVSSSTQGTQIDVDQWTHAYSGLTNGNHVVTTVTYKPDGTYGVQRFPASAVPGLSVTTGTGAGLGDLNADGAYTTADTTAFTTVLQSNNAQFNPAADLNGDGVVDDADAFLLGNVFTAHDASNSVKSAYYVLIHGSYVTTHPYDVNGANAIDTDTAGSTAVPTGATLTANSLRGGPLSVAAGGLVQLRAGQATNNGTSVVASLTDAGQIDLGDNALIVTGGDVSAITALVRQGYDGGRWDGQGVTSSPAAIDPTRLHAVGVLVSDGTLGTFRGQPAPAGAVLVAYTLYGDATLDGVIDGSDYARIDAGFLSQSTATPLTGWQNGDFNYDGQVDASDYTLIDDAFDLQPVVVRPSISAVSTAEVAAVPEPSAMGVVATIFGLSVRKPRRRGE